jgi:hypothetical protein
MAEPRTEQPTTRLPDAAGEGWFLPPSQLAELALGAGPSRPLPGQHSLGRHLAFLPLESLDLDLDDPLQREFGDYCLLEKLGQGGMGVVYRARQASLDREVAVKLLAAGPWASPEFIARFRREAQSAARMQHPNIVAIHEVGSSDELNYFSMQLVRGESLAALRAREGRLAPPRAAEMVRTIAEAVDYAHRLGVLHLDLKPGNVLIDQRGEPLVADFGLARRLDETRAGDGDEIAGTPSYMAPEQALASGRLQPATDVYGLGAILYELLTGTPPFLGATPQATLKQVVMDALVPARSRVPSLPRDLDAICARCLDKDPARRYPDARALADDLSAFLDGRATAVRPVGAPERMARWARRQPLLAGLALLLLLSFLAGFAATSLQWRRAENNAATARTLLWDSRRLEATRLAAEGRGFDAAALLLANIEDGEAAGRHPAVAADRRRLGTLLVQGVQLIDRIMVDDASPTAAELSDDGAVLAVGFNDLSVRWYDAATLTEQGRVSLMGVPTSEDMGDFHRVPSMLRFVPGNRLKVSLEWYEHWIRPGERDTSLVDLASARVMALPAGFDDASISADGGHAILHRGGSAQLWQTAPWRALGEPFAVPQPPMPTLLTRDGRYALSLAPSMAGFQLRDPRAPQRELAIDLPRDAGLSAWAESADGRWLALGDHAGRVHLVDLETLDARRLSLVLRDEITTLGFSEDDHWLAAGNSNGAAMVFDVASGAALLPDSLLHEFPISRARVVRRQQLLVVTGNDQVALWRLPLPGTLGHRPHRLHTGPTPLPGAAPYAVSMSADSGLLATVAVSGEIRLWRLPPSPLQPGRGAALAPEQPIVDAQRAAEVAWDRLRLVELDGRGASAWISFAQPPSFAEILPRSRELLVVSGRTLHLLDADSLKTRRQLELPGSPQRLLATADESLIVLGLGGSEPGRGFVETLLLVDRARGALRDEQVTLDGPLALRASADGQRLLAIGPREGATQLLALPSLQPIGRHDHDPDAPVINGSFAPDQRTAMLIERAPDAVAADDALLLWEPSTHATPLRRLLPGLLPLAVAAVGSQVYVGGMRQDVLVAAGQGERPVSRLSRAEATAPVAASADGHWLARAYRYRDVELVDPASGTPLGPPLYWNPGGIQLLTQLAFTPDGSALLARTSQGRRLRWPLAVERREVAALRAHLAPLLAPADEADVAAANAPAARAVLRRADPGPWPRLSAAPAPAAVRHVDAEPVPPRTVAATPWMLDLGAAYSLAPTGNWGPRDHVIASLYPLPWGVQRLGGVDYDIRGAVGLNAPTGPDSEGVRRSRITGIAVPPEPVAAFHLLLLAGNRSSEAAPREYARLRLHYADGGEAAVPLRTGRDVPGWAGKDAAVPVAWEYGLHLRLLGQPLFLPINNPRLPNPFPGRFVTHLDVESGAETWNAPVIFAISAEPVIAGGDCCMDSTERRPPAAGPK